MAAAYASLVSLLSTMDQIQSHPILSTSFNTYQFQSLREKVGFLLDFVENYSDAESAEEAEYLLRRIGVAAHVAEDIIEIEAADRIRITSTSTHQCPSVLPHLQKIIDGMDFIKEKAIKLKKEESITQYLPPPSSWSSSSPTSPATARTTTMVGFNSYSEQLLDQLTCQHSDRRILPIVGMGGIGKTTLASNVYENLLTVQHFDVRAWVTVSNEYSARKIVLQALSCLGESTSDTDERTDDELGRELRRILYGRRSLIVLDDVWSVEVWEAIQFYFPDNNNGSRIVVTSRLSEVVDYFGSTALVVDFLDDINSWRLFCETTFAEEDGCPPELEHVGKKIVKKCKGLPLSITVIGGVLGKSSRTPQHWEKILRDKDLILDSGEGNTPWNILYMSYKHLPIWLKSCFAYLGLFPEDYEIDVFRLVQLWIAEGFIRSKTQQTLEEVAESYIKQLVECNLLMVIQLNVNKPGDSRVKVHDLIRDLCIRIGNKEKLFYVQRCIDGTSQYIVDERRARYYTSKTPSIIRPLIVRGERVAGIASKLLRVAHDIGGLDYTCGEFNLRFLCHEPHYAGFDRTPTHKLLSSVSLLWRLQTLIVSECVTEAPPEIWKMPQLRHIQISPVFHLDPPPSGEHTVLENLQSVKLVQNLILSEEVCKRMPNIRELGIDYQEEESGTCYLLQNVGCFNKLESLSYSCYMYGYSGLQNLKFPSSLKELRLEGCELEWSYMTMIASLPCLEILELSLNAVVGAEWNFDEEEFICLKYLVIDRCRSLVYLNAESSSFPVLERIKFLGLPDLEEIPTSIGDIPTLEEMYMRSCSESATISALEILKEQESLGNQSLHLRLDFTKPNTWREKIQELGFSSQNLLINNLY